MIRVKWDSNAYRPHGAASDASDLQEVAVQPSRALPPRSKRAPAPLPPAGLAPMGLSSLPSHQNHQLSPVVDILGGSPLGSTPGSAAPHRRTPHKKW
jgi:hypothetical protein